MNVAESRKTFFRQSGWMAMATLAAGVFNTASQFVVQRMDKGEVNIFVTALSVLWIVSAPGTGMQASFAAQTAGMRTDDDARHLSATMRGALSLLLGIMLIISCWWLFRQEQILANYHLTQPAMLWVLMLIGLTSLITPVLTGVLQGQQDFAWYGWVTFLNGAGRFFVLGAMVYGLHTGALGALIGVLAGNAIVLVPLLYRTRGALLGAGRRFDWRSWLKRLVPVTVGLAALTFIMQADTLMVREKLVPVLTPDAADGYTAVRTIALAMIYLVGGLTSVMFPKVARSFQLSEETEAFRLTILLTVSIAVMGALAATILPELPLRILSPARLWPSHTLVPAFCWAAAPLALANVLVWSVLARECYRAVPWIAALAIGYWVALQHYHDSLITVIRLFGLFSVSLVAVCSFFLWRQRRS